MAIPAVPRACQKGSLLSAITAATHPFCPFMVLMGESLVVDPGLVVDRVHWSGLDPHTARGQALRGRG